ncbi:hypothetical protein QE152_g41598, partial [Popillia japonica]
MNVLGDWSAPQKDENVITILEGLRQIAPDTEFDFVDQGWDPRNMNLDKVAEAAAKAKSADLNIVVAGEYMMRFRNMNLDKVAEAAAKAKSADLNIVVAGEYMMRFRWSERTDGEDTDRSDIDLVGSRIDQSVRRILDIKFRLGLFENPYADEEKTMEVRLCEEHRATALEAA